MTRSFKAVLVSLIGIFIVGAIVIVINGRPVANMTYTTSTPVVNAADEDNRSDDADDIAPQDTTTPTTKTQTATTSDTYTMADVQAHTTSTSCWSVVNGNVYDLTTWIARHPGGPGAITNMCGKDGSSAFNRQHGSFAAAQSALALLKIGKLAS